MSKLNYYVVVFSLIGIMLLISFSIKNVIDIQTSYINENSLVYKSDHDVMFIYNHNGQLMCYVNVKNLEYSSKEETSWFIRPLLIIYNKNKIPKWLIKSEQAKLTSNYILYLYGNVIIKSINNSSYLRKVTANSIKLNLNTQDLISKDVVNVYGRNFISSGLKMKGNLHYRNIELIKKVKTSYELKNK